MTDAPPKARYTEGTLAKIFKLERLLSTLTFAISALVLLPIITIAVLALTPAPSCTTIPLRRVGPCPRASVNDKLSSWTC